MFPTHFVTHGPPFLAPTGKKENETAISVKMFDWVGFVLYTHVRLDAHTLSCRGSMYVCILYRNGDWPRLFSSFQFLLCPPYEVSLVADGVSGGGLDSADGG